MKALRQDTEPAPASNITTWTKMNDQVKTPSILKPANKEPEPAKPPDSPFKFIFSSPDKTNDEPPNVQ